jgi:hypothetical protein
VIVLEVVLVVLFALLLALLLTRVFGRRGPGPFSGLVFFALLLALAIWALGGWLHPIGPPLWGVAWLGYLLVGVLVAFLIAALVPRPPRPRPRDPRLAEAVEADRAQEAIGLAFSAFFWVVILLLIGAIVARYAIYR